MSATELKVQLENQLDKYPVALDPQQVAEVLGVSRRYVDKLLAEDKIQSFNLDDDRVNKQKRVLKANLIAFMLQQSTTNNN